MAYDQSEGTSDIRTQYYDKVVKGFAERAYKFKPILTIDPTSAWKNFFFRENPTALSGATTTGMTGNLVKGIPRGANFPQANETWEKVASTIVKYGLESNISWEDLISDEIDVKARTLMRIAEGVAKAVDTEIYSVLSESGTPTNIQSITIAAVGAGRAWDVASAQIIDDLLQAKQLIAQYDYDVSSLTAFISPKDYRSIMNYLAEKGAQFPKIGESVASNGVMGNLSGINLVVSNNVTASQALIVVPKRCGTWKELVPLQTTTKEDPYKSLTIRSVELGATQLTDPKAVVLIRGTQLI